MPVNFDTAYTDETGDLYTYRVQAFTSRNGQILNIPPCLAFSKDTLHHLIHIDYYAGGAVGHIHRDIRDAWRHTGNCNAPSPYNGGWVNVYEVDEFGEHFVGQVNGDLVWKDFTYRGTTAKTIKLEAFPDQTNFCQVFGQNEPYVFLGFDGYGIQNPITVEGAGELPLARFACPP